MNINFKNIMRCIILLVTVTMLFSIMSDILKVDYYRSIIKEKSTQYSYDDEVYSAIETVLPKYFEYIKNKEYSKLEDSSAFYAKKTKDEFTLIASKLNLNYGYSITIEEVYKIDEDIFRCVCYTTLNDKVSEKATVTLKINTSESFFKVVDIII